MTEDSRISEIRAVLDAYYDAETSSSEAVVLARVTRILDRPAPAPEPGSVTEWGYRARDDQFVVECGEQDARAAEQACPRLYDLVRREVGPWVEVQP